MTAYCETWKRCVLFKIFLCRICIIGISHIYYSNVQWTFFIIYTLVYCFIGSGM